MASSGLESGQRPTPTDAAPPGGHSGECNQHPWPLISPYLPSHASTSPQILRGCIPRRGRRETRGRPGPVSQVSGFPTTGRMPDHRPPAPKEAHGDDPCDNRRRGKKCGGSRYLPVPQLQDHRIGHSTTLPSISSGAKQAFIAALAARLRRRASQRVPVTEGNCSPAFRSPRLDMRQRTLFPRSTIETLGEMQAAPPFHRTPRSAPSFPGLSRACLESSLSSCAPVGGREA